MKATEEKKPKRKKELPELKGESQEKKHVRHRGTKGHGHQVLGEATRGRGRRRIPWSVQMETRGSLLDRDKNSLCGRSPEVLLQVNEGSVRG